MTAVSPLVVSPITDFAPQTLLRLAIRAAYRRSEAACIAPLLDLASLPAAQSVQVQARARSLVTALRAKTRSGGVEGLIHEYSLSSQEGVALMCLAEALLRIPDNATRDALIRDKIAGGDWRAHLGKSPSLFVNAATWGLLLTGKLTATASEASLGAALTRLVARGGEPVIRRGTDLAMRMMGEQFVTGQTIGEALVHARAMEAKGFRYSYDMLGEAATTAEDAARYYAAYETAIHAIGQASAGRGIYDGPGISIKLSALHPRYGRAQRARGLQELLPRLKTLAGLAKRYEIGLNIDAEEAERLDFSLDLLEALAVDPDLAGWNGLGFVIQAYGKRCPFVIDWLVDLARRSGRRLMVRLVKGAYWDSEIKRAQVDGQADFPVFTRKVHTDVSYLACARKLLAAPDAIFAQFATHNAQTLSAVMALAGPNFYHGQYEFQCLHGMGEPLYEEVVGESKLGRPCRIYAPVGSHETLLAYLVRRLLENGANTSFVNRIADPLVPLDSLIEDPVMQVRAMPLPGAPHPAICAPRALYGAPRANSAGLDFTCEETLAALDQAMGMRAKSGVIAASDLPGAGLVHDVLNPADLRERVGQVRFMPPAGVEAAMARAVHSGWGALGVEMRAGLLLKAADALEAQTLPFIALIVREAGKSYANALAEVREAVDFLRYYATESLRILRGARAQPLGVVVCISPWNFPLAIFTGQVAAALVAGNAVLAKPAEETPLVAAEAVRLLHAAGVPEDALQLVPGDGAIGAALVAHAQTGGVVFTGSTEVARLIQRQLAGRVLVNGRPLPLVAETGGQNAMIVDSSALAEQVVGDVIASAFDSAGQRCSALRILCVQEEAAPRILAMLKGAMAELAIGNPYWLARDIGPVIHAQAQRDILAHIAAMRARGFMVHSLPLPQEAAHGTFVAPTLIEITRIADVEREVFGPVLHVLRYKRSGLDALLAQINESGFGLTFGLHTRLDETIARVVGKIEAGNLYINRNMIGATVGVQPFGGRGLSGTGPKAGGPLYLARLLASTPPDTVPDMARPPLPEAARVYADTLRVAGFAQDAARVLAYGAQAPVGAQTELAGPVGERNVYALRPRGKIGVLVADAAVLRAALGAVLATGNRAVISASNPALAAMGTLPPEVEARLLRVPGAGAADVLAAAPAAVLCDYAGAALQALCEQIAALPGAIIGVQALSPAACQQGEGFDPLWLLEEVAISTNTAAAGGNASLMAIG